VYNQRLSAVVVYRLDVHTVLHQSKIHIVKEYDSRSQLKIYLGIDIALDQLRKQQ
jgi:hypothetical protein